MLALRELRNNGVVKNGETQRTTPAAADAAGAAPSRAATASAQDGEQHGTRQRVARSILDHGPSTAAELADRLALTQAAVRRHLDALAADGVVEAREKRVYGSRGRGRPAKVFALTDGGRDAFDHAYDALAVEALSFIARAAGGGERGAAAVLAFARERARAQGERYRHRLEAAGEGAQERTRALAEALTQDGYAAMARTAPGAPGSSCASTTARWRTPPSAFRSCARRRPRSSPACWAPMCSGSPPSRTAMASAPPSSPPRHRPATGRPRHRCRRHPPQRHHALPGGTPHDAPHGDRPPRARRAGHL